MSIIDGREITEQPFPEGSTGLKVRSERRCHAHGSELNIIDPPSEREANFE